MSNDEVGDETPTPESTHELTAEELADELAAHDLDEDGKVSIIEDQRGKLGIVDAHLAQIAEEDGVKGKLAEIAHKVVDHLDND